MTELQLKQNEKEARVAFFKIMAIITLCTGLVTGFIVNELYKDAIKYCQVHKNTKECQNEDYFNYN